MRNYVFIFFSRYLFHVLKNQICALLQLSHLNEDLQRKETKWAAVVTKLQEQVKLLEKENQHLHQDNHKLKLRGVSSKVKYSQQSI